MKDNNKGNNLLDKNFWKPFKLDASAAAGGDADEVFLLNDKEVTANYTIPKGKNSTSVGDIIINAGIEITISDDSSWVIL